MGTNDDSEVDLSLNDIDEDSKKKHLETHTEAKHIDSEKKKD